MSIRFRRSMRLFPGVRLNFSRSGISTTVGVRGASMTLGGHGTHLNVGLPGTGLSYRTKISPGTHTGPSAAGGQDIAPALADPVANPPALGHAPGTVEIRSADVSVLTSPGLGELKRLINEAATRRVALNAQIKAKQGVLAKAQGRLRFARTLVVRLFTQGSIPRLAGAVIATTDDLENSQAELAGCYVEIDFALDDITLGSYAALVTAFEALRTCERIWDITATVATNRRAERTIATQAISRSPVKFDLVTPSIVKTEHKALRLGNVAGRDIQVFPGFVMMRDGGGDFALIEYGEVDLRFAQSRFIEEERVPSDSDVVGQTWKKANKDGSPDRRFKDNSRIPIVGYGEVMLGSPTGLFEAYMFSSMGKSAAFAEAFNVHRRTLAKLTSSDDDAVPQPETEEDAAEEIGAGGEPDDRLAILTAKPKTFAFDWVALALILAALAWGGNWTAAHGPAIRAKWASVFTAPAPLESRLR